MKTRPKEQYADNDSMNNYVVNPPSPLGEGRTENTIYPQGCEEGRNPVMEGDEGVTGTYGSEQKVGDHHEYE